MQQQMPAAAVPAENIGAVERRWRLPAGWHILEDFLDLVNGDVARLYPVQVFDAE